MVVVVNGDGPVAVAEVLWSVAAIVYCTFVTELPIPLPQIVELNVRTGLVVHDPWSGERNVASPIDFTIVVVVVVVVVVDGSYTQVGSRVHVISGEVTVVPFDRVAMAMRR